MTAVRIYRVLLAFHHKPHLEFYSVPPQRLSLILNEARLVLGYDIRH